ncbi:MAG: hypothetical protein LBN09_08695 [Clostridioides sp.]|jgi:hypothetical protein|nr:hypothetical protein [Clostridioides sp.]
MKKVRRKKKMTSKEYLKFRSITNIVNHTCLCVIILLKLNNDFITNRHLGLALLFTTIVVGLANCLAIKYYPKKHGIDLKKIKNEDLMKQDILSWTNDEREINAALKVYASRYLGSNTSINYIFIFVMFSAVFDWGRLLILNILLIYILFHFWLSNIMFVRDWHKYAELDIM